LFGVVQAGDSVGFAFGAGKSRQKHGGQYGDDGNDYE
jgi:hypothetical protein